MYRLDMALQKVREIIGKKPSRDYGGLTEKEVNVLKKVKTGKAKIIRCKDSEDFFKKMGLEE